jgi:hypothetical protein
MAATPALPPPSSSPQSSQAPSWGPAWYSHAAIAFSSFGELRVSAPLLIPGRSDLQVTSGRAAPNRVLVRHAGLTSARNELRVIVEWFTELVRLTRTPA